MSLIRLNHFISQADIASRRGADTLIEKGKVKLNGKVVRKLGLKLNPETDTVEILHEKNNSFSWKRIEVSQQKLTIALYKPKGFVTSMKKQGSSPIISSLVPQHKRLFPIGRLDKDSEGLLLLTNDGDLAQRLMHPSKHIPKTYKVTCIAPKNFTENILKSKLGRLSKGATLKKQMTQPAEIQLKEFSDIRHRAELLITLQEGKNRQIRRMLGLIDLEVLILTRVSIGNLTLENLQLKPRQSITLSDEQISLLF